MKRIYWSVGSLALVLLLIYLYFNRDQATPYSKSMPSNNNKISIKSFTRETSKEFHYPMLLSYKHTNQNHCLNFFPIQKKEITPLVLFSYLYDEDRTELDVAVEEVLMISKGSPIEATTDIGKFYQATAILEKESEGMDPSHSIMLLEELKKRVPTNGLIPFYLASIKKIANYPDQEIKNDYILAAKASKFEDYFFTLKTHVLRNAKKSSNQYLYSEVVVSQLPSANINRAAKYLKEVMNEPDDEFNKIILNLSKNIIQEENRKAMDSIDEWEGDLMQLVAGSIGRRAWKNLYIEKSMPKYLEKRLLKIAHKKDENLGFEVNIDCISFMINMLDMEKEYNKNPKDRPN